MGKEQIQVSAKERRIQHAGVAGIAVGLVTLLACELPIILALVGLGGLSSFTSIFKPDSTIEFLGIAVGVMGILLTIFVVVKRVANKTKQAQT